MLVYIKKFSISSMMNAIFVREVGKWGSERVDSIIFKSRNFAEITREGHQLASFLWLNSKQWRRIHLDNIMFICLASLAHTHTHTLASLQSGEFIVNFITPLISTKFCTFCTHPLPKDLHNPPFHPMDSLIFILTPATPNLKLL